jgi:hypothetical protein
MHHSGWWVAPTAEFRVSVSRSSSRQPVCEGSVGELLTLWRSRCGTVGVVECATSDHHRWLPREQGEAARGECGCPRSALAESIRQGWSESLARWMALRPALASWSAGLATNPPLAMLGTLTSR